MSLKQTPLPNVINNDAPAKMPANAPKINDKPKPHKGIAFDILD